MSKILKHGKNISVKFKCALCGCEFIAKVRDCFIDFDSHACGQGGDVIGTYDAHTNCPECVCACRSSEIIFEEREQDDLYEENDGDAAEWVDKEVRGTMTPVCSRCGVDSIYPTKYCGNCGIIMKNGY